MQITYEVNCAPTIFEAGLKKTSARDAHFYVHKDEGFIRTDVKVNERVPLTSVIHSLTSSTSGTTILSNTTGVLVTNVEIENIPYYFRLHFIGGFLTKEDLIKNSAIAFVESKGVYYTNEIYVNKEVVSGVFVHSIPVVSEEPVVKFKSKAIELSYTGHYAYAKPQNDLVCQPTLINTVKVHVPSFYTVHNGRVIKCIEGDIQLVNKKEVVSYTGNSISVKDLVHKYTSNFFNKISNKIYLDHVNYETEVALVRYQAKLSSHIFSIDSKLYLKITNQGLEYGSKADYDILFENIVDKSKVEIIPSRYLSTYKYDINPLSYVFVNNRRLSDSENVSLRKQVNINFTKPPSEVVYIQHAGSSIYQHTNDTLPITTNDIVVEDTFTDVWFEHKTDTPVEGIEKSVRLSEEVTYYRKDENTWANKLIHEESSNVLLEDALLLLLEA